MTFEIYQNKKNQSYFFNVITGNHQTIMISQGYKAKQSAQRGIASVKKNIALESRFQPHSKRNGQHYFHLTAGNGEIIADSQLYPDEQSMQRSIKSLMKTVGKAKVVDLTR